MGLDGETRRCLLELVYDVLPEDEAIRLRERIEADPELARVYTEMYQQAALFRDAARWQTAKIELREPSSLPVKAESVAKTPSRKRTNGSKGTAAGKRPPILPWTRAANWGAAVAAVALLLVAVAGYWYHRGQLADISAEHLRLTVIGPARLRPDVAGHYEVVTSTVTDKPASAQIEFSLYSPDGRNLLMGHKEKTDEDGYLLVAIPAEAAIPNGAELKIVATYNDKVEQVVTRLVVEPAGEATHLALDAPAYRPGETVRYRSVTLSQLGLTPGRPMPVHFEIHDPQGTVVPGSATDRLTRQGVGCGQFQLPAKASPGQYTLVMQSRGTPASEQRLPFQVRDEQAPPAKGSPADPDKLEVSFYPEGGSLVAGLENRIYFSARDASGKPVKLVGHVVDASGEELAVAETTHDGLGVFSFEPRIGDACRLKIEKPAGARIEPKLPEPAAHPRIVLTTGSGLFEAGEPLEFNVRATADNLPLVAAAFSRDVLVGHQALVTNKGANEVEVPLDEASSGVLRLCIYDYSENPPRLVAERLVYRRPSRVLTIRVEEPSRPVRPGDKAELSLQVIDEEGKPVQATLGVAVAAAARHGSAAQATWPMAADFLLNPPLKRSPALEDPGFFLLDDAKSAVALDLLLGTQGWRRLPDKGSVEKPTDDRGAKLAASAEPLPPAVFDNLLDLRKRYQESLNAYRANRTIALSTLTILCVFGGAVLLLAATMLTLLNVTAGLRLWIPITLAAVMGLLVGRILISPESLDSSPDGGVAFVPFSIATKASPEKGPDAGPAKTAKESKPASDACEYRHQNSSEGTKTPHEPPRTLYWNPSLPTDAKGRARILFDVPGSVADLHLRIDAHGVGRIGSLESRIATKK
jgi:hypothetical protein